MQVLELDETVNESLSILLDELVTEYTTQNNDVVLFLEQLEEKDDQFKGQNKKYLPTGFRQRVIDMLMTKKTNKKNGV